MQPIAAILPASQLNQKGCLAGIVQLIAGYFNPDDFSKAVSFMTDNTEVILPPSAKLLRIYSETVVVLIHFSDLTGKNPVWL